MKIKDSIGLSKNFGKDLEGLSNYWEYFSLNVMSQYFILIYPLHCNLSSLFLLQSFTSDRVVRVGSDKKGGYFSDV